MPPFIRPIVAIIGLLAGFATPALVSSDGPNVRILFGYLALIVRGRLRGRASIAAWGWLAYGVLARQLLWTALWIVGPIVAADLLVMALFLAARDGGCGLACPSFDAAPTRRRSGTEPQRKGQGPEFNAWIAATGSVLLFAVAVTQTNRRCSAFGLAAIGALGLALCWTALCRASTASSRMRRHSLALVLLGWDPAGISRGSFSYDVSAGNIVAPAGALMATEAQTFVLVHLAGRRLHRRHSASSCCAARCRPFIWAGVSILGAAVILAGAYAKISVITTDTLWAMVAAASAALAGGGQPAR